MNFGGQVGIIENIDAENVGFGGQIGIIENIDAENMDFGGKIRAKMQEKWTLGAKSL